MAEKCMKHVRTDVFRQGQSVNSVYLIEKTGNDPRQTEDEKKCRDLCFRNATGESQVTNRSESETDQPKIDQENQNF
ncbi:hypothetical protein WSM22_41290 [Cytophagales bacterium WSM2-2]|nr:hypothetical protein WSM22_41290 [Cytophagales bacterium WSM2-2]